jgi:hypothetical protein
MLGQVQGFRPASDLGVRRPFKSLLLSPLAEGSPVYSTHTFPQS